MCATVANGFCVLHTLSGANHLKVLCESPICLLTLAGDMAMIISDTAKDVVW